MRERDKQEIETLICHASSCKFFFTVLGRRVEERFVRSVGETLR
jgi:hypothetical protein